MKILLVTDNRFWRKELGSQRRIASLCEHLSRRGHTLQVLFQGHLFPTDLKRLSEGHPEFELDTLGPEYSPLPSHEHDFAANSWPTGARRRLKQLAWDLKRLMTLRFPLPSHTEFNLRMQEPKLADFADPTLLDRFRICCSRIRPQAVIIEYVRLAYLLDHGKDALPSGCLTLIDTHDVQHERQSRFHALGEVHDIDITPSEEARALALADAIIAIQSTDATKLRQLVPRKRIIVAGFPSVIHVHSPYKHKDRIVRIGFFGSDMAPNQEAAKSLLDLHFPVLRATFGAKVELHIHGGVCNVLEACRGTEGVVLHGFVEDLDNAYGRLDIIANPVNFGGGLKIKNIEALCHGRALLTTPIGAEGLENGLGRAFMVASDPHRFSDMLEYLVSNDNARHRLAIAGQTYAQEEFSEDAVYSELDQLLDGEKGR
jgi:glycosyltransferase involved in cell wall biosynthesis